MLLETRRGASDVTLIDELPTWMFIWAPPDVVRGAGRARRWSGMADSFTPTWLSV
jgi:hypothetical protein